MIFKPSLPVSRRRIKLGTLRQAVSIWITRPHGANSTTQKVQSQKAKHFPMAVSLFYGKQGKNLSPLSKQTKVSSQKEESAVTATTTFPGIFEVNPSVSTYDTFIKYLEYKVNCFKAGRLSEFYDEWKSLTSDVEILDMVAGQRYRSVVDD